MDGLGAGKGIPSNRAQRMVSINSQSSMVDRFGTGTVGKEVGVMRSVMKLSRKAKREAVIGVGEGVLGEV